MPAKLGNDVDVAAFQSDDNGDRHDVMHSFAIFIGKTEVMPTALCFQKCFYYRFQAAEEPLRNGRIYAARRKATNKSLLLSSVPVNDANFDLLT